MDIKLYRVGLALALALGTTAPAVAETFRCPLADRIASYQQTPCAVPDLPRPPPATSTRGMVLAPLPPARKADAAAAAAVLTPRKREIVELTARLERCRSDQPGFAARTEELYQAWRRRHAATLSDHRQLLALKVRAFSTGDGAACSDQWVRELEPLARTPDPRFSSVEKTWAAFVAALQAADRPAILSCVSGPVAQTMGERLEKLPDAELRRMGANIRELKVLWGDDYDREALVVHGNRVDGVVFHRNVNEEWKLREMKAAAVNPATPRRSSPDS